MARMEGFSCDSPHCQGQQLMPSSCSSGPAPCPISHSESKPYTALPQPAQTLPFSGKQGWPTLRETAFLFWGQRTAPKEAFSFIRLD